MSGQDLYNSLTLKQNQLNYSIKQLSKTGIAFAEAERNYKIAVCKKALELKSEGMPVTLIQTIIYGYPDIATLRFTRDSAEVIYKANLESINGLKLEIRITGNQLDKEISSTD